MNSVLSPSTPITPIPLGGGSEYSLPSSDHDSHAHHSSYSGGVDHLRRDTLLSQSTSSFSSLRTQYMLNQPPTQEAHYQPGVSISDSSPGGSNSTSPSSNASSLATAYSSYPQSTTAVYQQQHHTPSGYSAPISSTSQLYTTPAGAYPHPYSVMSSIRPRGSSITDSSLPSGMLPPTRSPGAPNHPVSPPLGTTARHNYTTSTPHLSRHIPPVSHDSRLPYSSLPDHTPRTALPSGTMPLSPSTNPSSYSISSGLYPHDGRNGNGESPPFQEQENLVDLTCDGRVITPHLDAKIEKGFFYSSDRCWTCYRRNYFSVQCSYSLNPHIPNGALYLNRSGKKPEQIQALAVSLSAVVDGTNGKVVELVQHTPKRDKGPQASIGKEKISPTPPTKSQTETHGTYALIPFQHQASVPPFYLPLQHEPDPSCEVPGFPSASHNASSYTHTFERIQFKSATANNGKRRAAQQYYHLIVEVWADVRNPRDAQADWVKVAQKLSAQVVVRGRSPSHYQNEGPNSTSRGGSGGSGGWGGSGGGGPGNYTYGPSHASGARGLGGSLSLLGSGSMGSSIYRGGQYSVHQSPIGSHSVSSSSSVNGEGLVNEPGQIPDADVKPHIEGPEGYVYYPSPIYEGGLPQPIKSESAAYDEEGRRLKSEYPTAGFATGWTVGGCGRYQGVETSRGYYPDLHAGY